MQQSLSRHGKERYRYEVTIGLRISAAAAYSSLLAWRLKGHLGVQAFQLGRQVALQKAMDDLLTVVAKVLQGCCQEAISIVWHDIFDLGDVGGKTLLTRLTCTTHAAVTCFCGECKHQGTDLENGWQEPAGFADLHRTRCIGRHAASVSLT